MATTLLVPHDTGRSARERWACERAWLLQFLGIDTDHIAPRYAPLHPCAPPVPPR